MRLLISLIGSSLLLTAAASGDSWQKIISSVGLNRDSNIVIASQEAGSTDLRTRAEQGALVVITGESEHAARFGFRPTLKRIAVRSIVDARNPKLQIIWQNPADLPVFDIPPQATVFVRERWQSAPVMAGLRQGKGAVLWLATDPGATGFERYPYLLQAIADLGVEPAFRSARLWAFFDSSYRTRVDVDYFAARWRKAGISTLHVAAWHYNEPDTERDEYLKKLIEACHRHGILVYAWFELPHVSERFWADHPQWREKTAVLQDAYLDWRKLMNLYNRDCFAAAAKDVRALIKRFEWDGVNLAELYFESLEGQSNPARFTPFNDDVREAFKAARGVDPITLIGKPNPEVMAAFLGFRAGLVRKMQKEWIGVVEEMRINGSAHLDLVLTHVDDRFDTRMRDLIGADAERTLPLLETYDFTFLVEDPATIWHLGPDRYAQIASRYQPLTKRQEKLAIDINIVERYQDVYPTKQQTGTELFQLVHTAARSFARVALYFENSILTPDLKLLSSAAAVVDRSEVANGKWLIESPHVVGVHWTGPALVNGKPWAFNDGATVWLPAGRQTIEHAVEQPALRLLDFNGDLKSAESTVAGLKITYQSDSRAVALLDKKPARVEVDGAAFAQSSSVLLLPRGSHVVMFYAPQPITGMAARTLLSDHIDRSTGE
jgi:hypothetical protein